MLFTRDRQHILNVRSADMSFEHISGFAIARRVRIECG
jgi:hypothetical protein